MLLISCRKNKETYDEIGQYQPPNYDTTAIDSFSAGATSVDVAERIRMSSQKYRDSVQQVMLKQAEERKKQEEKEKLEKAAKEALEKEKAKEKKPTVENPTQENNPQ